MFYPLYFLVSLPAIGTQVAHHSAVKSTADFNQLKQQFLRQQRKLIRAERVHQMRVAVRHLRSILNVCGHRGSALCRVAKPLAQQLGAVRDLDVLLDFYDRTEHLAIDKYYLKHLQTQWQEERKVLRQMLKGPPYRKFKKAYSVFLESLGESGYTCEEALLVFLNRELKATKQRGRALSANSSARKIHRLRLQCKQLRYLVEMFEPIAPTTGHTFSKHAAQLQTLLGEYNDEQVAVGWLRRYAKQIPVDEDSKAQLLNLGGLIYAHQHKAQQRLQQIPQAWRKFDRKCTFKVLQAG